MSKSKLGDAKQRLSDCESKFINAARLVNGVVNSVKIWKDNYGKKRYYNGFKAKSWDDRKQRWADRFLKTNQLLTDIEKELNIIKDIFQRKHVPTEHIYIALKQIGEKRELVSHISKELNDLNSIISEKYVKASVPTDAKKEGYIELSKIMDQLDKEQVDNFFDNVFRLNSIQTIYRTLEKQMNPILVKASRVEQQEQKEERKVPKSFKEQLLEYSKKEKERKSSKNKKDESYDLWFSKQYQILENFANHRTSILTSEDFGIIEMPIVLINAYVNNDGMKKIQTVGYITERLLGNYFVVKNALLLGIKADSAKEGLSKCDQIWNDFQEKDNKLNNKTILQNKLVPIGPLVKKNNHFYAWLAPHDLAYYRDGSFMLNKWDFSLK